MRASRTKRKVWLETLALLGAAVLASMLVAPALGQGTSAPGSPPCSPSLTPGSPGTDATAGSAETNNPNRPPENLSNRLAQSGGVICPPPSVDPEMKLPTPETGTNMPVIPPPENPGSDPAARPK